jgi:2-methylisocitrate lyase-like PEP mutase family enzyme
MNEQLERAELLKTLHIKGDPLILFNIWDSGSALAMRAAGAKVIATGSWSVAASHGYDDGERLPFNLVLANLKRIIKCVDLPVTIDLESGYGISQVEIKDTVKKVIEAGVVGINIEDQKIGSALLYSTEEQCVRISAVDEIAKHLGIPIFINARTDIFLKIDAEVHNEVHLKEAISRATAYAKFGANGFFVPGLNNPKYIQQLCIESPIPVNVMMSPNMPSPKQLAELGVARISYGPYPYLQMIDSFTAAGENALMLS